MSLSEATPSMSHEEFIKEFKQSKKEFMKKI